MAEPYIGEIRNFGFYFAPKGWALCDGQLLSISQYPDLFSLLGTTYGGNGNTSFALPDLRGRVSIHEGQGPGLGMYVLGQKYGYEAVTLVEQNLPAHSHTLQAMTKEADTDAPMGGALANARSNTYVKPDTSPVPELNTNMNEGSISVVGGGYPVENRQPFLATNYCIALFGTYPSPT